MRPNRAEIGSKIFNKFNFWKKFSHFLLLGISVMLLLAGSQSIRLENVFAQSIGECIDGKTFVGDGKFVDGCEGKDDAGQPGQPGQPGVCEPVWERRDPECDWEKHQECGVEQNSCTGEYRRDCNPARPGLCGAPLAEQPSQPAPAPEQPAPAAPTPVCTISASPNPCNIASGATTCATAVTWNTNTNVDIKMAETGQLFAQSGSGSTSQNATWITQSGATFNCIDRASGNILNNVRVTGVAASACVSNGSCSAAAPACGTTTTGVDNCGNACTKTGDACPVACVSDGSCSVQTPTVCGQANVGVDNCGNPCVRSSAACPAPQPQNFTLNCPNGASFNIAAGEDVNVNALCQIQQQTQIATGGNASAQGGAGGSTGPITITVPTPQVVFATSGNVGVGTTAQVLGVTTLPKTGLPELAWAALAFIPAGFGLRRFKRVQETMEDDPNYIWEDRKFKTGV